MYIRRSNNEVLLCALLISLAWACFLTVNVEAQNTPPANTNRANTNTANRNTASANTANTNAANTGNTNTATQAAGSQSTDTGVKKNEAQRDWTDLSASEFEARARACPKTAQLKSNILPGGSSMVVEVQAPIKPNSVFYARLSDGGVIDLPLDVVWNPEQPEAKESATKVKLQIPDLGFTFSSHSRRLVLVAQEAGSSQITPSVSVVQPVKITNWWLGSGVAVLCVLAAYGVAVLAVGWRRNKYSLNPVYLTTQRHGRASLSRFQIFGFTLLVFGLLVFIFLRIGVLSDISPDILLLLGISAAGATGSAVTEAIKSRLTFENWSWLRNKGWLTAYEKGTGKDDDPSRASWSDLLKTDKDFDIYKFQLLTVSFVVAVGLLGSDITSLAKFDLPPNLLGLLGLSNVVFIAGTAVGTSVAELNEKTDKLRVAEKDWVTQVVGSVTAKPDQKDKLEEAKKVAPEKYQTYVTLAREAARMLQSIYGMEGTKFKKPDIDDAELMPEFP